MQSKQSSITFFAPPPTSSQIATRGQYKDIVPLTVPEKDTGKHSPVKNPRQQRQYTTVALRSPIDTSRL